jgi:hypothetical protein
MCFHADDKPPGPEGARTPENQPLLLVIYMANRCAREGQCPAAWNGLIWLMRCDFMMILVV